MRKAFDTFGVMIDMSRNAVMSIEGLKRFLPLLKKWAIRDTYHKAGRCPLAFLLIGLDARMNCSKIKIEFWRILQ